MERSGRITRIARRLFDVKAALLPLLDQNFQCFKSLLWRPTAGSQEKKVNEVMSWQGLRFRLVVLVFLAPLPVFGLFAYTAAKNQQAAMKQAKANLQSQVLLAAVHQQRLVDQVRQLLGDIASGPSIKDTRSRRCEKYLKNLHSQNPEYSNLGVVGLDGRVSCRATGPEGATYEGDRPYFKKVVAEQKFSVGEYGMGRIRGQLGIGFGMPVYASEGGLNGVAFAVLDLAAVASALATDQLLSGTQLRVIDKRGVILANYPADKGLMGTQARDAVVLDAAKGGQRGAREGVDPAGVKRVYAYAPVRGVAAGELFVAISIPREVITADPLALLRIDLAALLAMTAFGIACAWWIGNRFIVKPARAILKGAEEVGGGNLAARIPLDPQHQGELSEIARTFNSMAVSLQVQRNELDEALSQANGKRILLDLILNSMSDGVVAIDTEGKFVLLNASARTLFTPATDNDASIRAWRRDHELLTLDGVVCPWSERPLMQALDGAHIQHRDLLLRRPGTQDRVLRMRARPLRNTQNQLVGALSVFNDVTDLKAAERFAMAQEQVLTLIASGAPLSQSLEAIVLLIEKSAPGSLCSILLVEGKQLRHGAAPSLPESFVAAIDHLPIAEGAGACGTAALRKEQVVVADVERDPLMQNYLRLLLTHNLRACWSTPVLSSDGEVLATFAIYRQMPSKPQSKDLELIATATRLARIVLERVRAEAALASSEARFRELAENVKDVFYNRELRSGAFLYVSPAYETIWQRSLESLYSEPRSYLESIHPEDRSFVTDTWELDARTSSMSQEYRIILPDGKIRWIHNDCFPVFSTDGVVQRVVGTARDITKRKLSDLALANTHRALEMLSRSSMAVNRMEDEASLLAEVCRVAIDVGGYRMAWVGYAQDDEKRSIQPMANAGYETGYLASIEVSWCEGEAIGQGPAGRAIRSGQPQQMSDISCGDTFYWHDAALQRGYRSTIALPLRDAGRSLGVLCLYRGDVEYFIPDEVKLLEELADNLAFGIGSLRARLERDRSQEAARQAVVKLREQASLLDRTQDAIVVRNLDRTLRFWNKGAERLYGWTADEVLGKTMETEMYRNPRMLINVMHQTVTNDGDWAGELEQVARDGSTVYVEARTTVVRDEQGRVYGVMGINTDIRERKRTRDEILALNFSLEERVKQRTAQLEVSNQQLEAFSYSVSHDLRSPLNTIDGFSNLLEKTLVKEAIDPLTTRSQHYLARIRAGVVQMGELIDAMLSLAQVSRASLRWEPVDLSALTEALLSNYQESQPDRAILLQVEAGLLAQGDSRLLKQVLDNLLGNAWKFTGKQACAAITVGHEKGSTGETVYFVRDNGAGFDMAYADQLFGAFQRLHSQTEFAGTGIGLATVQRIVAKHGGRVWAESAVGKGASFYFTLGVPTV
jgi:PAS domain S-box-containing protein